MEGLDREELEIHEAWGRVCQLIRLEMTEMSYKSWMVGVHPLYLKNGKMVVEVPSTFAFQMLNERYTHLIVSSISRVWGEPISLQLVLPQQGAVLKVANEHAAAQRMSTMLNPKYVFDTFVVGSGNRFAQAAAQAVAQAPGEAYNPLFIYGGVGLGKTHLMHAIGQFILESDPETNILYVSSETFTNELIRAIGTNKNQEFRNKFRNVDVLLIDDIQFIGGKEQTQEEFFHTFNTLHEAGKQIIISSDKQPKEIISLEDRLRSRFEWGLIADIQKPDFETRIAILRRKAELDGYDVPEEVNQLIASKVESNIRELEGSLTRVCAYASLTGQSVTLAMAETALHDMLPLKDPSKISPDVVASIVCNFYSMTKADLIGQKRNREIVLPRQIAMYLMRDVIDMSLPSIGGFFSGRDHTTVIHACNKITTVMKEDRRLMTIVTDLKKRIMEE